MTRFLTLRQQAYEANMLLQRYGLVVATFGNASAFDPDNGVCAIKPSGVSYEELSPEAMVIVDLDNTVVEGNLRPSSDTKTHTVLYRNFEGIRGVAHTHSSYAVAWAQAKKSIPLFGTTHADHLATDVPCTEVMNDDKIKGDYEHETGALIVETFAGTYAPREVPMVLVASHGPFTWGESAHKAVYNSLMLEEIAKMALLTRRIAPDTPRMKQQLIAKHYERKHGKNAYYGQ
jgi:L-ribulose-5-phosphate 4-epimerase